MVVGRRSDWTRAGGSYGSTAEQPGIAQAASHSGRQSPCRRSAAGWERLRSWGSSIREKGAAGSVAIDRKALVRGADGRVTPAVPSMASRVRPGLSAGSRVRSPFVATARPGNLML